MANEVDNLRIRINASAGNAAKSIDKLAAALEKLKGSTAVSSLNQLSSSLNKVATSSTALNKNINSLNKVGNSYNKTVGTMQSKTTSWGNSVFRQAMNIRASFLLIRGSIMIVSRTLGDCFKESSAYIENLNLFAVSMGENYDKAKEYAERVQSSLGIDSSAWMAYQGKFQNLATGFGIASDKAAVMSQTLTQLTYDLSSFFNVDFDTAFKKLQSGMTGQIKGLKEYGINLSVAALQEYADAHALNVKVRQLTEAERAILRYNLVMERTVKMQGDMARTIITPANSMRIFANQVTLAKRAIGNLISVVLVKFIPYMQAFVRVIEWVAQELAKLFGFELPKIDYSGMGELADATGGVNDAIEDVGDSAGTATKKVKELKKNLLQLMGFDEINIIKAPTEDTSASTGAGGAGANVGGGSLGAFADNLPTYDFLKNLDSTKADELFKKFKKIGQKVIDIVKWTIKWWDVIKFIGKVLIGIWAVGKVVKFLKYLQDIKLTLSGFSIVKTISSAFKTFFGGFAHTLAQSGNLLKAFRAGFKSLRGALSPVLKIFITLAATIAGFFSFKDLFYNLEKGTLTWQKSLLDIAIAAVAIGAAFALTGPVGGVIAILGTLAGAVYGVVKAQDEMAQSIAESSLEYQVATQRISDAEQMIKQTKQSMENLDTATKNYESTLANINLANTIIKEIEALNSKTRLTVSEQNLLKAKINSLNSLNIEGVRAEFDNTTGHVKQTNTALENMRKNMLKNAQTAALQEVITEHYKVLYKEMGTAKTSLSEYTAAQEATKNATKNYNDVAEKYTKVIKDANGEMGARVLAEQLYGQELDVAQKKKEQAEAAEKKLKESYDQSTEALAKAADGIKTYTQEIENIDMGKAGLDFDKGLAGGIADNQSIIRDAIKKMTTATEKDFREYTGWHSPWELTTKAGRDFDAGLIVGMTQGKPKVLRSVKNLGSQMISTLNKSLTGVSSKSVIAAFDSIFNKASNTFRKSSWSAFGTNISSALNSITFDSLHKRLSNVLNKGRTVFSKANWNTFKSSISIVNTAVFDSLHQKMNNVLAKASSVFSANTWENFANNVSRGFDRGIDLPTFELKIGQDTATKLSKAQKAILKAAGIDKDYMPLIYWKEYAMGGRPVNGEYFIARESGAELVGRVGSSTAVMNNDQIVAAVSQGVYNAVVGAMSGMQSGDGGTYNINVYPQIDGRTVGEASIEYHNGQVRQKGASPLIGVAKA